MTTEKKKKSRVLLCTALIFLSAVQTGCGQSRNVKHPVGEDFGWKPREEAEAAQEIVKEPEETTENMQAAETADALRDLYRTDETGGPAVGWVTDGDGTKGYCGPDGYLLTGFQEIEGSRYLFTDQGDMCTGCYTAPDGERYCFTADGRQYLNSVMPFDDGYIYYFGEDGKIVTGTILFPDGKTGLTDEEGHLYTGCHLIGDKVYDFTSEGRLRHTVDAQKPMVALTYDDGPSEKNTQVILDTLTANHAYATFFVLGRNVDRCADIIRNIENSGSEIGNHTYNHYMIINMDAAVTDQEISSTSSYIQMITGNRPSIMRPPTGAADAVSCANVAAVDSGYPLILWSVDTVDWQHHDAAATCEKIRNEVKDGSIILMHDMEDSSAAASQIIIPELIAAGYQLVTVSEMAAARGGMAAGQIYHHFDPVPVQTEPAAAEPASAGV